MGAVIFYHLTRSGSDDTVATLLGRALGQGWRVMVRGPDLARLAHLDDRLWAQPADSFLPHGLQGGAHDADQPVLLGAGPATNAAQGLMLIDGADVTLEEAQQMERVWVLFDGNDPDAVAAARVKWTALSSAGLAAQYWSEDSGRWEKKAEKAAQT